MKVGTDGLLLGAWAPLPEPGTAILDIGAGSGLISLMLAQRTQGASPIEAIELDPAACTQAATNVANSPWPNAVTLIKGNILTYHSAKRYSLIVSNPPFFQQSLPSKDARRSQARHTSSLPLPKLLQKAAELIDEEGVFSLVLPLSEGELLLKLAIDQGWYLAQRCEVKSKVDKPVQRLLLTLRRTPCQAQLSQLIIHQEDGNYSDQYRTLLKDFYLKF